MESKRKGSWRNKALSVGLSLVLIVSFIPLQSSAQSLEDEGLKVSGTSSGVIATDDQATDQSESSVAESVSQTDENLGTQDAESTQSVLSATIHDTENEDETPEAPRFTTNIPEQAEYSYEQGSKADALSVSALKSDGSEAVYQWYEVTSAEVLEQALDTYGKTDFENLEGFSAIDREHGGWNREYTPSTETEGTSYYFVAVTNEQGAIDSFTLSRVATLHVEKASEKEAVSNDASLQGETVESVQVEVNLSNKGKVEIAQETITVTDYNGSGTFDIDDALYAAHQEKYEGGAAAGYATENSQWGDYITKLWGDTSGNYGYYVNNAMAWGLSDNVKNGDSVSAMVYANIYPDTEGYAYFDKTSATLTTTQTLELTLTAQNGYDANWQPVFEPCVDATITVDDSATEVKTDANGKASITIAQEGTHTVSATKTKTVSGEEVAAITAPVCTVTVLGQAQPESFLIYTGTVAKITHALIEQAGGTNNPDQIFYPNQTSYTTNIYGTKQVYTKIKAANDGSVVATKDDGKTSTITWTKGNGKSLALPYYGKQSLKITVNPKDATKASATDYNFTINAYVTLSALSAQADGTSVYLDKEFDGNTFEYTLTVPASAQTLSFNAQALSGAKDKNGKEAQILYNGIESSSVAIQGKEEVTVSCVIGEGENALRTDYTIHLKKADSKRVTFTTTPEDAIVSVYDSKGASLVPESDGSYTGLFENGDYTYTVTKYGYIAQTGFIPTTGGEVNVSLQKAPDSGISEVESQWSTFRNSTTNMGISSAKTPLNAEETTLMWAKQLGTGWKNAPSVQIIVDDALIVMSGTTLYKLNLETGDIIAQATMVAAPNYGYTPPIYAEGLIICPLANGTVQAFNAKTLDSVWVYTDNLKGQSLTPITYSDGYIYTGFWNSYTKDAHFVCLSVTDEDSTQTQESKTASWKTVQAGGYYWAGSVVVGDTLIVGGGSGVSGDSGTSHLSAFNKTTGELVSKIDLEGMGDQQSSIAYDEEYGKVYFTTKTGYLCSAQIDAQTGVLSGLKSAKAGTQSTSTPVVYKGYVYLGVGSGVSSSGSSGAFVIANADTLEVVKTVDLKGYPQCSMLLSTAYEQSEGTLYFYSTYNASPGGISLIKVNASDPTQTELIELYDAQGYEQYCITSLICGEDGTIYYKNDSGYVFAVGLPSPDNVIALIDDIGTVDAQSGSAISTARKAYDALSLSQQGRVSNYNELLAAEQTYASIIEEANKEEANKEESSSDQSVSEATVTESSRQASGTTVGLSGVSTGGSTVSASGISTATTGNDESEKAADKYSVSSDKMKKSNDADSSQQGSFPWLWLGLAGVALIALVLALVVRSRSKKA